MYFNNKKSTNIDSEFNEKNNFMSRIVKIFSKYKVMFLIMIGIIFLITIMIVLFVNRKVDYYLTLNGEEIVTIYQGGDYVEPGYNAYNSLDEDLTSDVMIESNLNNDVVGEYEIVYTVSDVSKIRIVKVIDKPQDYTFIHLTSVNNSVNIYLKKGEEYTEPGYLALSSTGEDLTNKVTVTGEVDTSKKGTYKLTYSVIDRYGVTISVSRKVIVMDSDISLSLDNDEYTNKEVTINVNVIDEYFDYMILPDNTKVTTKVYSYKVSSNGKYIFKVYDKKGNNNESSIEVKNIDKINPSGSCNGSFENGVSTINVGAKDNIGISKYVINGKTYTNSNITINSELKSVDVTIYDKAGNSKSVSCTLEDKNTPLISDKSITFSYEYKKEDGYMPYALYTPSSASGGKKTPLIIWLHGSGEVNGTADGFKNTGILYYLNKWTLDGFNAYVLCPHLTSGYAGTWNNETSRKRLNSLVEKIKSEYNIDTDKIIMSGHSMGGQGALYMAAKNDCYSALVVCSGYYPQTPITGINIPAKGYVGTAGSGEDQNSIIHMEKFFVPVFGSENLIYMHSTGHGTPKAIVIDENGDNKSDLVEWMLSQ